MAHCSEGLAVCEESPLQDEICGDSGLHRRDLRGRMSFCRLTRKQRKCSRLLHCDFHCSSPPSFSLCLQITPLTHTQSLCESLYLWFEIARNFQQTTSELEKVCIWRWKASHALPTHSDTCNTFPRQHTSLIRSRYRPFSLVLAISLSIFRFTSLSPSSLPDSLMLSEWS